MKDMAYNQKLANRIRERLEDFPEIEEKEMMGGLVFMKNGKMCAGVFQDDLMCRIDKNFHHDAIQKTGGRTMDFGKRPMIGYVLIDESGMKAKKDFDYWIGIALEFNEKAEASSKKEKNK